MVDGVKRLGAPCWDIEQKYAMGTNCSRNHSSLHWLLYPRRGISGFRITYCKPCCKQFC